MLPVIRRWLRFTLIPIGVALLTLSCGTNQDALLTSAPEGTSESISGDEQGPRFQDREVSLGSGSGSGGSGGSSSSDSGGGGGSSGSGGSGGNSGSGGGYAATIQTKTIDGAEGGAIEYGRYKLVIPPGAFEGEQEITVVDPQLDHLECYLFPEGLQFNIPVIVEMDLRRTNLDSAGTTIYWYDPSNSKWVDVNGVYSANDHKVRAELHHFSTYRPGRAGW